ncbi:MAG: hemagglutinin repeat-containing protein, partial [Campylobacterales bacterium]|nr:hemagglutinin repeat-containing protein [Campylobacterales bacterium]
MSKDGLSLFKKTKDTLRDEDYKSQGSLLSSGKSLEIQAKKDVYLENVDMLAKDDIELEGNNVSIVNTDDRHISKESHESIEVGLNVSIDTASLSAEILKETKSTSTTTVNQSTINSGGKFKVKARNDIKIVSADINAKDEVSLEAFNNVAILEAKNTNKTTSSKESLKGELSLKVKNEYVEVVKATLVLNKAIKSLKDSKSKYDDYKKDIKTQENKLAKLKQDFKNKKIGIEQNDIDEFKELISDLKSDESFYLAAILTQSATIATKTTALIAQTEKAASTSETAGFSVSFELKGTANKEKSSSSSSSSVASNINTNNFKIKAGNKATIQGSNVNANNGEIDAKTIEVLASEDKSKTNSSSKTVEVTASIGTAGIGSTEGSVSGSNSSSSSTTYNNSKLNFNNLELISKEDTIIKGATVNVAENLDLDVGGSLDIQSVQNTNRTNSSSISASSSGSANASMSKSKEKTTVLTSLNGNTVNIKVKDNTNLKGALISSTKEDGVNIDTNTLSTSNLSNRKSSRNISLGGSIGTTGSQKDKDGKDIKGSNKLTTVSGNLAIGNQNSKSKTLATITSGNIKIRDKKNSTKLSKLNRNKDDVNLDLYDVKSDVKVSVEVDTRLLSEDGRKEIKKDVLDTKNHG